MLMSWSDAQEGVGAADGIHCEHDETGVKSLPHQQLE